METEGEYLGECDVTAVFYSYIYLLPERKERPRHWLAVIIQPSSNIFKGKNEEEEEEEKKEREIERERKER